MKGTGYWILGTGCRLQGADIGVKGEVHTAARTVADLAAHAPDGGAMREE